ncbi:hypothetical protein [Prochlorococcus sp. MIT 0703]
MSQSQIGSAKFTCNAFSCNCCGVLAEGRCNLWRGVPVDERRVAVLLSS